MSKKSQNALILIYLTLFFGVLSLYGQGYDQLHGDQNYSTYGVHSGNQIRTSFWNDGQIGYRNPENEEQVRGEWPINSGHMYIAKISSYFGSEVRCEDGVRRPIVSEANGTRAGQPTEHSSGDASENGDYWSMCPLPGFYNENPPPEEADQPWVAMNHKDWSWPYLWPDKMDDPGDPGWHGYCESRETGFAFPARVWAATNTDGAPGAHKSPSLCANVCGRDVGLNRRVL